MDYKKKYKEALERMKSWARGEHPEYFTEAQKTAEFIFPELKESAGEKVKRILHSISSKMSFHLRDIFTEEEFQCFDTWSNAWLEKQGDKDKLIKELSEYKVKYTQEVLEKHINNKDERLRKTTIAFLKEYAEQGYENAVECIAWLENKKNP